MRAALIDQTGTVENVIVIDPDADPATAYTPPEELILVTLSDDSPVGPGWSRTDTDDWLPPTPPTAETTTDPGPGSTLEALAALLDAAGITPEQVIEALG